MKDELKKLETRIRWAAKDALADRKHDESENYLGFADELRDLIATLPEDAGCVWEQTDEDGSDWHAQCGNLFSLNNGGPGDNDMAHCCFCGKRIHERAWVDESAAPATGQEGKE